MQQIDLHWHPPYLYRKTKKSQLNLKCGSVKIVEKKKAFSIRYGTGMSWFLKHSNDCKLVMMEDLE